MSGPDWTLLASLIEDAVDRDERMTADPNLVGKVDQARAGLRDQMAQFGVDLDDPKVLHALLVGVVLCASMTDRVADGHHPALRHMVPHITTVAMRSVASSLADHIPAEARP